MLPLMLDILHLTACWSYCNPVNDTGNKSLNLISTCGLFLLDNTVSVASEKTGFPRSVVPNLTLLKAC